MLAGIAAEMSQPEEPFPATKKETAMHYRNGREAKNGDKVVVLSYDSGQIECVGILYDAVPGNDYCNGSIAAIVGSPRAACLAECLHVDDLAAILKEKGLDKRPAGK
jgi:hypothetical protein